MAPAAAAPSPHPPLPPARLVGEPRPFALRVPDEQLDDLRRRLAATRHAATELEGLGDGGWEDGTPTAELRALVEHWAAAPGKGGGDDEGGKGGGEGGGFDWRAWERHLNAVLPQFTAVVEVPVENAGGSDGGSGDGSSGSSSGEQQPASSSGFHTERITLHFAHVRAEEGGGGGGGDGAPAVPLLLLHGWPGSIVEFHKLVPRLQRAAAAAAGADAPRFHIVVPSLPGYGYSSAPRRRGFGATAAARAVDALMRGLGYRRYLAQGGDWGAIVCRALGLYHAESCAALHLNMAIAAPRLTSPRHLLQLANAALLPRTPLALSQEELEGLSDIKAFRARESAYQQIQGTKPQTLAAGLADSPAGLLAWIGEKLRGWAERRPPPPPPPPQEAHAAADKPPPPLSAAEAAAAAAPAATTPQQQQEPPSSPLADDFPGAAGPMFAGTSITRDEALANVSLYWFSGAIASSVRLYKETLNNAAEMGRLLAPSARVAVPTAVAVFPRELSRPPRAWLEGAYDLRSYRRFARGGHFAALERASCADLCDDVAAFAARAVAEGWLR